jgi:heterotetrameric sarcosine oxidase gamma subunit
MHRESAFVLEHRAALDQLSPTRHAQGIDDPHLRVVPVTHCSLLLVQGHAEDPALRKLIQRELGLDLPVASRANARGGTAILWLGPKEWLIETSEAASATGQLSRAGIAAGAAPWAETHAGAAARTRAEATALHTITDISDALAGFDLSGSRAADVLMSGCSLDLGPQAFSAGQAARTAIADVPAIIWSATSGPETSPWGRFRCWVDRSFAAHFWDWLADSPSRW